MTWWAWLLLGLVLITSEVLTPGAFFLFFFGVSAFILSLLTGFGITWSPEIQWSIFSALSVFFIAVLRRIIVKARGHPLVASENSDRSSPVCELGITTVGISAGGEGHAELRGTTWTARNVSTVSLPARARVKVTGLSGLTLEIVPEK